MLDSIFKKINHLASGYKITLKGEQLVNGYKPDLVMQNGNNFIIMESEHGSSRKHFIGGMIKAAKFLNGDKNGVLVYVIFEKKNTNVDQIYRHLSPYFHWIKPLTNLKMVYIISDKDYYPATNPLELFSNEFLQKSKKIS